MDNSTQPSLKLGEVWRSYAVAKVLKENEMTRREMRKLDARIKTIKKAAEELKTLSGGMQAVDRNADRILASVKMLEINVTDLLF